MKITDSFHWLSLFSCFFCVCVFLPFHFPHHYCNCLIWLVVCLAKANRRKFGSCFVLFGFLFDLLCVLVTHLNVVRVQTKQFSPEDWRYSQLELLAWQTRSFFLPFFLPVAGNSGCLTWNYNHWTTEVLQPFLLSLLSSSDTPCSNSSASTAELMAFSLFPTLILKSGTTSPKTCGTLLHSLP